MQDSIEGGAAPEDSVAGGAADEVPPEFALQPADTVSGGADTVDGGAAPEPEAPAPAAEPEPEPVVPEVPQSPVVRHVDMSIPPHLR